VSLSPYSCRCYEEKASDANAAEVVAGQKRRGSERLDEEDCDRQRVGGQEGTRSGSNNGDEG
jgi:hypothetical protein